MGSDRAAISLFWWVGRGKPSSRGKNQEQRSSPCGVPILGTNLQRLNGVYHVTGLVNPKSLYRLGILLKQNGTSPSQARQARRGDECFASKHFRSGKPVVSGYSNPNPSGQGTPFVGTSRGGYIHRRDQTSIGTD